MKDIISDTLYQIATVPSAYLVDLQGRLTSGSVTDYTGEQFDAERVKSAFQDLSGAADFSAYNFTACIFNRVPFGSPYPGGITMASGSYIGTQFNECKFENTDFTGSDFENAIFSRCSGSGIKFEGCSLIGTQFNECNFYGVDNKDCDVSEAIFDPKNNLRSFWFKNSNVPVALAPLFKESNEE